jgi:hypothetical protein
MYYFDGEKEKLIKTLSEKYSQNIITMEEYERILDYINKIRTEKEINIIEKIILENDVNASDSITIQGNKVTKNKTQETDFSMFSSRTINIEPIDGNGGNFTCFFGADRIILEKLPKGRTVLNVNSIFGLTEIVISRDIKIINKVTPLFSGIFIPNEVNGSDEELPELCIIGKAIFGNITIKIMDEIDKEINWEKHLKKKNEIN